MAYRVDLTPRAQTDLDKIYATITREAPFRGPLWFDRFEQSIRSLSPFPERCIVVAKLSTRKRTVRQLLFGRRRHVYRIYFVTVEDVVKVLHIRHGARRDPKRL
jgi:toxin ParE1/3/4